MAPRLPPRPARLPARAAVCLTAAVLVPLAAGRVAAAGAARRGAQPCDAAAAEPPGGPARAPVLASAAGDTALLLPAEFGPEGVAPGRPRGSVWVSSMRTGRVVRYRVPSGPTRRDAARDSARVGAPVGAAGDTARRPAAVAALGPGWAALGMAADTARGLLWVAASAIPQAAGYAPRAAALAGRSALRAFDLETGAPRARADAPRGASLGDVAAHPDGRVFASDGRTGAVYVLAPGARRLEPLVPAGRLRSSQGMAVAADGRSLTVADYATGLARVDLATGAVTALGVDTARVRTPLTGLDGLVRLPGAPNDGTDGAPDAAPAGPEGGDELYAAVQNGRPPGRVLRLRVRGACVVEAEPLLDGHPALAEPTLAALVDDGGAADGGGPAAGDRALLVVAASLWPAIGDDGRLRAAPRPAAVLRLRLPGGGRQR